MPVIHIFLFFFLENSQVSSKHNANEVSLLSVCYLVLNCLYIFYVFTLKELTSSETPAVYFSALIRAI